MNRIYLEKFLRIVALTSALSLMSCSGGSGVTAGAGGSGIGGTGVTLVRGNVATVVAALESTEQVRMVAGLIDLLNPPAIAQSGSVANILIFGGGQSDTTDELGRFELIEVTPSPNFALTFTFSDGEQINLVIGSVPELAAVEVNNIVVDKRQGNASPSSVEVKDNSGSSDDDGSDDGESGNSGPGGGSDDDDSDDSETGNSGPGGGSDDDDSNDSNSGSGSSNSGSG